MNIGVAWMGGIGDSVMLNYLCRALRRKHPEAKFTAIVRDEKHKQMFKYEGDWISAMAYSQGWRRAIEVFQTKFDLLYECGQHPMIWEGAKPLLPIYLEKYFNWHITSKEILSTWSKTYFEYIAYKFGLEFIPEDLQVNISEAEVQRIKEKYQLPDKFVTVHNGCDAGNAVLKLWNFNNWNSLVKKIRELKYPVYQIGANNDNFIFGTSRIICSDLADMYGILKLSSLHIDTEGGLVHIAHSVGGKTLTLYGPTSPALYGYPEGKVIYLNKCPTCWWAQPKWSSCCMKKNRECLNMALLSVNKVFETVEEELSC